MGEFFEGLVALGALILSVSTFTFPVSLSIWTGNWWFMSLFSISWIPAWAILVFCATVIETLEESR